MSCESVDADWVDYDGWRRIDEAELARAGATSSAARLKYWKPLGANELRPV